MEHNEEKTYLPISKVVRLNELIDYQEGSIVSRTLLNKKNWDDYVVCF